MLSVGCSISRHSAVVPESPLEVLIPPPVPVPALREAEFSSCAPLGWTFQPTAEADERTGHLLSRGDTGPGGSCHYW